MKSPLLRIFLVSWLLSFLGVSFSMFLLAWIEGPESVRVAVFAAPFWAAILSPVAAVICTLLYRVCREGRNKTLPPTNHHQPVLRGLLSQEQARAFKERGEVGPAALAALWVLLPVVAQQYHCVEEEDPAVVVYVAVRVEVGARAI